MSGTGRLLGCLEDLEEQGLKTFRQFLIDDQRTGRSGSCVSKTKRCKATLVLVESFLDSARSAEKMQEREVEFLLWTEFIRLCDAIVMTLTWTERR